MVQHVNSFLTSPEWVPIMRSPCLGVLSVIKIRCFGKYSHLFQVCAIRRESSIESCCHSFIFSLNRVRRWNIDKKKRVHSADVISLACCSPLVLEPVL
jgi:hypothetical protein